MSLVFVRELLDAHTDLLERLGASEVAMAEATPPASVAQLLQVALVNEIGASDLAATWMPSTREVDVKVALARQAGDEAGHFQLVERRLLALGGSTHDFAAPPPNVLFQYLRGLESTVERIAAGQVALESIAFRVNESFIQLCHIQGDDETARLYEQIIQPEELQHHRTGCDLLARYATTAEAQALARSASIRALEIAADLRAASARKLGTRCFPGC